MVISEIVGDMYYNMMRNWRYYSAQNGSEAHRMERYKEKHLK